jgi:hypothetical protein
MKTSFTTEEQKYNEIFDNYINGNISDFRNEIRKLSKRNLLRCIDLVIQNYGPDYSGHDIVRILMYHL